MGTDYKPRRTYHNRLVLFQSKRALVALPLLLTSFRVPLTSGFVLLKERTHVARHHNPARSNGAEKAVSSFNKLAPITTLTGTPRIPHQHSSFSQKSFLGLSLQRKDFNDLDNANVKEEEEEDLNILTQLVDFVLSLFVNQPGFGIPAGYLLAWLFLAYAASVPQLILSVLLYGGSWGLVQQLDLESDLDEEEENGNSGVEDPDQTISTRSQVNGQGSNLLPSSRNKSEDYEVDENALLQLFCFVASLALGALLAVGARGEASLVAQVTGSAPSVGDSNWVGGIPVVLVLGVVASAWLTIKSNSDNNEERINNSNINNNNPEQLMMQQWDQQFKSLPNVPDETDDDDDE